MVSPFEGLALIFTIQKWASPYCPILPTTSKNMYFQSIHHSSILAYDEFTTLNTTVLSVNVS